MLALYRTSCRCLLRKHPNLALAAKTRQSLIQRLPSVTPQIQRFNSSSSKPPFSEEEKQRQRWSMVMSDDEKKRKQEHIEKMKQEEVPTTMIAKVKYYFRRYWYIAVPAHMVCCTTYIAGFYMIVYSGVDVVSLLQTLHIPDVILEKIQNTPPQAGALVVALILYKIATPLRYLTTLGLIQAAFWGLRRMGKLRTAREVEYKARIEYEKGLKNYGRRLYRNRNRGVREIARANSEAEAHRAKISSTVPPGSAKDTKK